MKCYVMFQIHIIGLQCNLNTQPHSDISQMLKSLLKNNKLELVLLVNNVLQHLTNYNTHTETPYNSLPTHKNHIYTIMQILYNISSLDI
jgi:hypothetical protein